MATAKAKLVKPLDLNEDNEGFQEGDQKGTNTSESQQRQQKVHDILFGQKTQKIWMHNYKSGTKYELYRVPLKGKDYSGLKFRDIVMILYQKRNIFLIALEVRLLNQTMVFVNPYDYVLEPFNDYFGYVIHYCMPDFDQINNLDLNKTEAKNFFIIDYLNKQDAIMRKEKDEICMKLAKALEREDRKNIETHMENFYVRSRPVGLNYARMKKLDKHIENHIVVCGIVRGIKNLILPLRSKFSSTPRKPIVILSNDNLGDENLNGDCYVWSDINLFEDIYLIKGSALQSSDLEKARVSKATAVIILGKSYELSSGAVTQNNLDAETIFMYR